MSLRKQCAPVKIDVITIFPGMLDGFLRESMMKRATDMGAVQFRVINLRDFAKDTHRTTDDRPYGGGPGMVMMAEPLLAAIESVHTTSSRVVVMTPQGRRFRQDVAVEMAERRPHLILVCGHYEGIDERVIEAFAADELSIGDYILTNGVLAAAVVVDAVVRLLPGVLGGEESTRTESFNRARLEYPQYTRPSTFRGMSVPAVLLSGNHAAIAKWRDEQSEKRTRERRPDLWNESGGAT